MHMVGDTAFTLCDTCGDLALHACSGSRLVRVDGIQGLHNYCERTRDRGNRSGSCPPGSGTISLDTFRYLGGPLEGRPDAASQ